MAQAGMSAAGPMRVAGTAGGPLLESFQRRLIALENLVRAIEDELSDGELEDEQKLQNIGERVATVMDGL